MLQIRCDSLTERLGFKNVLLVVVTGDIHSLQSLVYYARQALVQGLR